MGFISSIIILQENVIRIQVNVIAIIFENISHDVTILHNYMHVCEVCLQIAYFFAIIYCADPE